MHRCVVFPLSARMHIFKTDITLRVVYVGGLDPLLVTMPALSWPLIKHNISTVLMNVNAYAINCFEYMRGFSFLGLVVLDPWRK